MIRKTLLTLFALALLGASLAQASTWEADPAHSHVDFKVQHMMISKVPGSFEKFTCSVNYDDKDVTQSSVQVTIDAASINTANEQRDTHLRSPDFFDVAKFPQLTFVSKRIEKTEGGLKIIGDLTIHGVNKEVTLDVDGPTPAVTDPWGMMRMGASATARIARSDFGVVWNKVLETGGVLVGDAVEISIEVELVKK